MRMLVHDLSGAQRVVSSKLGFYAKQCSSGALVEGRNSVVRQFLDQDTADWLLFVDADMVFHPDTLERLIAAADPVERPVVGGLCFAVKEAEPSEFGVRRFRCEPTLYGAPDLAVMSDYPRDELVRVGATGAACILSHRSALETLRGEYGDGWFDKVPHVDGGTFSEDFSYCIRLDRCDIPIHVHTGIKTGHDKGVVVFDEAFYDQQEAT